MCDCSFFFFKQNTAYEMRISDGSSDVCSSDLGRVAGASRLPRLSAVGSGGYNNYLGSLTSTLPGRVFQQAQTTATIGLSATIPLYQGGLPAAQVRRATALESQALEQTIFIERRVVAEADRKSTRLNSSH